MGGAIYLGCDRDSANSNNTSYCNVFFHGNNVFRENEATNGGAIMWTRQRPTIANTTKFIANQGELYADNIGSYPSTLRLNFITNNDYVNPYNKTAPTTAAADSINRLLQ